MAFGSKAKVLSKKGSAKNINYNPASGSVINRTKSRPRKYVSVGSPSNPGLQKVGPSGKSSVGSTAKSKAAPLNTSLSGQLARAGLAGKAEARSETGKGSLAYYTRLLGLGAAKPTSAAQVRDYATGSSFIPSGSYSGSSMYGVGSSGSGSSGSPGYLDRYLADLSAQNTAINIGMNRENNLFSADQAQIQRDFQEYMSNTAHQREVRDLQAAGLNPVLSANAGAAVPASAAASASNFNGADATFINALAGILESTISANAQMSAAGMAAQASMYGADQARKSSMYSADRSAGAQRYNTNQAYKASMIGTAESLIGDLLRTAGIGIGAYGAYKTAGVTRKSKSVHYRGGTLFGDL